MLHAEDNKAEVADTTLCTAFRGEDIATGVCVCVLVDSLEVRQIFVQ